jgi:hypothetical protein
MRILLASVLASLLVSGCAANRQAEMDRQLMEGISYIALNSDLPVAPLPKVIYFAPSRLNDMTQPDTPPTQRARIVAAYYPGSDALALPDAIDTSDPVQQSTIVHELVHYLQDRSGDREGWCPGAVEREAYDIQRQWLADRGIDNFPDAIGLNSLALFVLTTCGNDW